MAYRSRDVARLRVPIRVTPHHGEAHTSVGAWGERLEGNQGLTLNSMLTAVSLAVAQWKPCKGWLLSAFTSYIVCCVQNQPQTPEIPGNSPFTQCPDSAQICSLALLWLEFMIDSGYGEELVAGMRGA